ncbi:MAG: efflux RND transporter periplasmic adaptor subunit [Piscirickettsiaceae bacterium]|nr:efflux RND transporter periplasmic adaptor subunit [Piscirickettsiaceae bacterium]
MTTGFFSFKVTFISVLLMAAAGFLVMSNSEVQAADSASAMPPPPEVDVMVVTPTTLRMWSTFSGKLAAVDSVEIKPLVGGRIEEVFFQDGELVDAGAPLFLIDPRPYAATAKRFEAQLLSAKSRNKLAEQELERTRGLVSKKLISLSLFDQSKAEYEVTLAAISEAKNALEEARIDLDYATIRAPFEGRISRAELTVGNVVEVNTGAPVLATLVSQQQVYAEFNVDEQRYIQVARSEIDLKKMPVTLRLAGDDQVVYQGHLHSFDNQLDSSTGTIRARALFENTDGVLRPGMYANIALGSAEELSALMIPQSAVGTNQSRKFVLIVGDDQLVAYREVVLGQQSKAMREVVSGLVSGERIITNGIAKVRPGMPVTVNLVSASATD